MTDVGRRCVEVAERFADGQADDEGLEQAEKQAKANWSERMVLSAQVASQHVCAADMAGRVVSPVCHVSTNVLAAIFQQQPGASSDPMAAFQDGTHPVEEQSQTTLLRCIFGNPFRPVAFAPHWRSETAVSLATGIYDERAFDRLPILADALEEAGCDNADVLAHCRSDGPHARGCWVVDGVLGRE